ncbi:hypothetical protein GCM10010176_063630 [Nonomuraea spiralis]|nr:hypothetical protein GCM10010176_063630 [Nonomuraea spiralis]
MVFSGAYAEAPRWATLTTVADAVADAVAGGEARGRRARGRNRASRRNMDLLGWGETDKLDRDKAG